MPCNHQNIYLIIVVNVFVISNPNKPEHYTSRIFRGDFKNKSINADVVSYELLLKYNPDQVFMLRKLTFQCCKGFRQEAGHRNVQQYICPQF